MRHRGVDYIRLAMYSRSGFHHSEELFNHPESHLWLESQLEILRSEFPNDFIFLQNGEPRMEPTLQDDKVEAWDNRTRCTSGRDGIMICADGKVIPCEQMPEIEEMFCGDLTQQSLLDIWNSKKLNDKIIFLKKDMFKDTPCYDCEDFHDCIVKNGYCFRDTTLFLGKMYTTPENCPKYNGPFIRCV